MIKTMPLNKREQNLGVLISFFAIFLLFLFISFSTLGFHNEIRLLSALVTILISTLCLCLFVVRNNRKENKVVEIDYLNVGTQRYILGIFMLFYGAPKLFGTFFDYQLFALDSKLIDASEFELAWFFYGKNKWQELFAGIMEFVPGILLLHRRTYYVASILLLPVTSQVFILNLFFKIGGITFPAAMILLACNVYIIYSQKDKIIHFFKSLHFSPKINLGAKTVAFIKVGRWAIILLAVLVIFRNVKPAFIKSDYQVKYAKLIGAYTLEAMTKNNIQYTPTKEGIFYKDLYIEKQSRWNILRRFNNKADAFIIDVNTKNDSVRIFINKGGIGDEKDIIDSSTVLKGIYSLNANYLTIKGIQLSDTLELKYRKQDKIRPKEWFW
ncbi:MAG TPA: hypothetical protein VF622_04285 [Segetibacter sp.]|jgi:hypothetical protein